jgi:L,D-peptidoglycan transpeptidase YkuD (ErfK/YbiS/YcfS/YnhG family)
MPGRVAMAATVKACEKRRGSWPAVLRSFPAVVGRSGFAPIGAKREGDGKTPSGAFPVEAAFGYAEKLRTAMPYWRVGEEDVWVDDPSSPDYNQLKKRGETGASSFEEMKRSDGLYEAGLVLGYNRDPVVKGMGSAIFAHVWKSEGIPTSGCVAMERTDLLAILSWLDPLKNPVIILGYIDHTG